MCGPVESYKMGVNWSYWIVVAILSLTHCDFSEPACQHVTVPYTYNTANDSFSYTVITTSQNMASHSSYCWLFGLQTAQSGEPLIVLQAHIKDRTTGRQNTDDGDSCTGGSMEFEDGTSGTWLSTVCSDTSLYNDRLFSLERNLTVRVTSEAKPEYVQFDVWPTKETAIPKEYYDHKNRDEKDEGGLPVAYIAGIVAGVVLLLLFLRVYHAKIQEKLKKMREKGRTEQESRSPATVPQHPQAPPRVSKSRQLKSAPSSVASKRVHPGVRGEDSSSAANPTTSSSIEAVLDARRRGGRAPSENLSKHLPPLVPAPRIPKQKSPSPLKDTHPSLSSSTSPNTNRKTPPISRSQTISPPRLRSVPEAWRPLNEPLQLSATSLVSVDDDRIRMGDARADPWTSSSYGKDYVVTDSDRFTIHERPAYGLSKPDVPPPAYSDLFQDAGNSTGYNR